MLKPKYAYLLLFSPVLVLLDQLTKIAVTRRFHLGESVSIIPSYFSLTYVQNTGAAFGIMAGAHPAFRIPFFIVVPMLALLAIGAVFRKIPDGEHRMPLAFSMVVGGAVGNLIDRLRLGFVVDFLDFHWKFQYHFPAFNVADTVICVGVGLLMLDLFTAQPESEPTAPPRENDGNVSSPS